MESTGFGDIDAAERYAMDGRSAPRPGRLAGGTPAGTPDFAFDLPVPGTRIHQYALLRELGRGGMGAVYLARDTLLGRQVAVKLLSSHDSGPVDRFLLEARATARCSHENIVVVHEVGVFRGNPFMVLEYIEGQQLTRVIEGRVLSPQHAVALMVPVVRALVCAHEHGIVHRDLKPDNILVTGTGEVKVVDFGIAKLVGHRRATMVPMPGRPGVAPFRDPARASRSALTQRGVLLGTFSYMSPEQWGNGEVDCRTDLWAAGIILFQMVTGKHPLAPLRGEELVITSVLDMPMPSVHSARPDIPGSLAVIIDRCLVKDREQRMRSARALLVALESLGFPR